MVSCIEIETGSLVFATLSLLSSCMSCLVCVGLTVHINILLAFLVNSKQKKVSDFTNLEIKLTNFGLYINVGLAVSLAIVVISLVFSIILTKGLLSKKAHLVKAYFIYGVTTNILSVFSAIVIALFVNMHVGLLSLFVCFLYCIILMMIKGTYVKFSSKDDQFGHKTLEPEKPNV